MKVALSNVTSGQNVSAINDNFTKIQSALNDGALWRNNPVGEPNQMVDLLDMNNNRILNLPVPLSNTEAARLQDVQDAIAGAKTATLTSFVPYKYLNSSNVQTALQQAEDQILDRGVNSRMFGTKGDGVSDDTVALQSFFTYITNNNVTGYIPDGTYLTSSMLSVGSTASFSCGGKVTLKSFTTVAGTFPCITITNTGNGGFKKFNVVDSYSTGIIVSGNLNNIIFKTISNCTRGIVLHAEAGSNSLDNEIYGQQIGVGVEGIIFENNGNNIMQGNRIQVNFISEIKSAVVFDDLGTHTAQANWDSNSIILQAVDPNYIVGASLFLNKSGFAIPRLTLEVNDWFGGFNLNDGTMTVVNGRTTDCHFKISTAAPLASNIMVANNSIAGFDSSSFKLTNRSNLGAASAFSAVSVANVDTFNGGSELYQNKFRISLAVPPLAQGQITALVFKHALSTSNYGGRFNVSAVETGTGAANYNIWCTQAGTEHMGMVRIWINYIGVNTTTGTTINIIVTCDS